MLLTTTLTIFVQEKKMIRVEIENRHNQSHSKKKKKKDGGRKRSIISDFTGAISSINVLPRHGGETGGFVSPTTF